MEETVNQETTAAEKTFTQSELDSIVADRLRRERSKYEGFDEIKAKAEIIWNNIKSRLSIIYSIKIIYLCFIRRINIF